jgi:hypothetical protein|nr:MAG TPA: hypothetical protein [Caudoviricetes sp.]
MEWHKVYLRKMTEEEIANYYDDFYTFQGINKNEGYDLIWEGEIPEELYDPVVVIYNIFDRFDKCVRQHTWADVNLRYYHHEMKSAIIYWAELPKED